jgi:prepilin-type N-terminal cleavage/methylation domain-containing protein
LKFVCCNLGYQAIKEAYMFMKNVNKGFTIVEMVVAMAIFAIVLALSHNAFIVIMRNVSTQSRQAQSNIEGIIGLELLRSDIVTAGYGLPWNPDTIALAYTEASNPPENAYNQNNGAPLAVQSGDNVTAFTANIQLPGTDYLVLRATNLATNAAAQRWCYMTQEITFSSASAAVPVSILPRVTTDLQQIDPFDGSDMVTVLTGTEDNDPDKQRSLVTNLSTTRANVTNFAPPVPNMPTPPHPLTFDSTPYFVYGIKPGTDGVNPSMPHNRADFYVRRPAAGTNRMSQRCAPNTGILFKGLVSHAGGSLTEMPLLDCVADFQVVYDIDPLNNGSIVEGNADLLNANGLNASAIRNQLRNIQIYILTHDGKKDDDYTYPNAAANPTIAVGPSGNGFTSTTGSTFNFNTTIGAGWEHYRWKVYRIVISPKNLMRDQR